MYPVKQYVSLYTYILNSSILHFQRMNRTLLLIICLFLPVINLSAQVPEGGNPYSSVVPGLKSTAALPGLKLKAIDIDQLLAWDEVNPFPYRYAVVEDTTINLKTSGKVDIIPGKGKIWRYQITSVQAKSIQVIFKRYVLPPGAKVFVYNNDQSMIRGAFTRKNTQPDTTMVLSDFKGNHMVVEYFEPDHPDMEGEIIIGSISQAYRDIFALKSSGGHVSINCPEGKNNQLEKHAVFKLTFQSGAFSYLCSGALINNARNDGTPYFITAGHCISKDSEASTVTAYFNYETVGCSDSIAIPLTINGAGLLSTADSSDYSLLLFNNSVPPLAQPYFAGWDVNDVATRNVTSIHHPGGNSKMFSVDYDSIYQNPVPLTWENDKVSPVGSHWIVFFDLGFTEGGSSGAPLFNADKQIIGQLHGGSGDLDIYGKFSFSWANEPAGYPGIREFLDPDNTGAMVLQGYYPPDNPPDAFFTGPTYRVCNNAPVKFEDFSVFGPFSRNWVITPSSYVFVDGTTETSPKPVVKFTAPGLYTTRLTVTNANGSDEMLMTDGILAGDTIEVTATASPAGDICEHNFEQVQLLATGAETYAWSILPADTNKVELNSVTGDTVIIRPLPDFQLGSGYNFTVTTIGNQETCTDTLHTTIQILKPGNDEINNAILLGYGKSIEYSNICASVEIGEPVPPYTSCTGQLSWCDEYGTGEDIVENSVWFKFTAPASGEVKVFSTGMDNEVALYEADNEAAILAGDYTIIGANDDRTSTDYHPYIKSANVIPGKTYWVQVDGSGGGLENYFYMHLYELNATGIDDHEANHLQVYPQPATEYVLLKGGELSQQHEIFLEVYGLTGALIHQDYLQVSQGIVYLDVSEWNSGIYLAIIRSGKAQYITRIIKD